MFYAPKDTVQRPLLCWPFRLHVVPADLVKLRYRPDKNKWLGTSFLPHAPKHRVDGNLCTLLWYAQHTSYEDYPGWVTPAPTSVLPSRSPPILQPISCSATTTITTPAPRLQASFPSRIAWSFRAHPRKRKRFTAATTAPAAGVWRSHAVRNSTRRKRPRLFRQTARLPPCGGVSQIVLGVAFIPASVTVPPTGGIVPLPCYSCRCCSRSSVL